MGTRRPTTRREGLQGYPWAEKGRGGRGINGWPSCIYRGGFSYDAWRVGKGRVSDATWEYDYAVQFQPDMGY
eukprot:1394484-Amorphochlora_amoeboformis.AAC.1